MAEVSENFGHLTLSSWTAILMGIFHQKCGCIDRFRAEVTRDRAYARSTSNEVPKFMPVRQLAGASG